MLRYKDIVARGIFYSTIGISEYVAWSRKIIEDYGTEIIPQIKDIRRWSLGLTIPASAGVSKLNCWQFMGCGRQVKQDLPCSATNCPCPASVENSLNGIHDGKNAGRICWTVLRTQCFGTVQKTYEQKYHICSLCDFYQSVVDEEDTDFLSSYAIKKSFGA